jgi:TonB family protein
MSRLTLCLAIVVALAAPAAAQSGHLAGAITDQTGAVLPGVEVRAVLRDTSGETTRSVVTDAKGSYELSALTPGTWALTATLPGFESPTRRVAVASGDSLDWSPILQIGMIQETVTITTDPPTGPLRQESAVVPPATAVAPAPRAVAGSAPLRVGGNIKPPRKRVNMIAVYPPDAVAQGVSGVVILSAIIGSDGIVREIKSLRSPNESLTAAATSALGQWEFTPTLLNGQPVDTRMTAMFNFQQRQ